MPPPLSAYIEAAKRFAKINSNDAAVVEDFYVRVFPDLPKSKKEKILAYILAHEGPARPQSVQQPIATVAAPPTTPQSHSKLLDRLTISTLPSFFGAALAKSFNPVAQMPRRLKA